MTAIAGLPTPDSIPDTPGQIVDSNFGDGEGGIVELRRAEPTDNPEGSQGPTGEELVFGKFKSIEDAEKAYKELERKFHSGNTEEKPGTPKMGSQETPEGNTQDNPEETPEETPDQTEGGFDISAFQAEFEKNGSLSDASYEALDKAGLSREFVDLHVQAVQALEQVRGQELFKAAGGEKEFRDLVEWGSKNLSEAQRNAFDGAVETAIMSGDFTQASMLIQAVKAQLTGGEPSYVNGGNAQYRSSVQPFANRSEMTAAMRDARYNSDPRYVAEVQERLRITEWM